MKTSLRVDRITTEVKAAFVAADAKAALACNPITHPTSPAAKIKAAIELDAAQSAAPGAVTDIRIGLKSALAKAKADLAAIELEGLRATQMADYIEGKSDALPATVEPHLAAACIALRGTSEGVLSAKKLRFAARNCEDELRRLNRNWVAKTESAIATVTAKCGLQVFRSAKMHRHVEIYERLVLRAKAKSEVTRKLINARALRDVGMGA